MCDTEHLLTNEDRARGFGQLLFSRGSLFESLCNRFNSSNHHPKKPSSLPNNWPYSSPEDLEVKPKRVIKVGMEQLFFFCDNLVKTSKYEAYNFLPKFLLEEFNPRTKIANCYFLLIAALQCVHSISNTNGLPTTLIPLTIVVSVDGFFQAVEDLTRHRADAEANSSSTQRYDPATQRFVAVTWAQLEVGDFVKVENRHTLPADVVVLSVAEKTEVPHGICYVETKSLDGETNLKIRNALPTTLSKIRDVSALCNLRGEMEVEHPNKLIDSFSGVLDLTGDFRREAIHANNVLLRGTVLRNTDWVIGIVVNTGHDTKIMMSAARTRPKTSNLEAQASKEIKWIILLLAAVCFTGACGQAVWNSVNDVHSLWYLRWMKRPGPFWIIEFFYFFLLHATFIPVSLYVSMSLVRYFQSYFMNSDLAMYYERTDTPAQVRTMTLNEELGQISHIFSDKTGTLTSNIMDFRKASINGIAYGRGMTEIGRSSWRLQGKEIPQEVLEGEARARSRAVPHVSFYCPLYEKHMTEGGRQKQKIQQFYKVLALCHDVVPERVDGRIKLSASNPDDEALVRAAEYFGFKFCDREDNISILRITEKTDFLNSTKNKSPTTTARAAHTAAEDIARGDTDRDTREERIEVLETLAFSSKRKRMSVIVRDSDGCIRLFIKGADTAILPRLVGSSSSSGGDGRGINVTPQQPPAASTVVGSFVTEQQQRNEQQKQHQHYQQEQQEEKEEEENEVFLQLQRHVSSSSSDKIDNSHLHLSSAAALSLATHPSPSLSLSPLPFPSTDGMTTAAGAIPVIPATAKERSATSSYSVVHDGDDESKHDDIKSSYYYPNHSGRSSSATGISTCGTATALQFRTTRGIPLFAGAPANISTTVSRSDAALPPSNTIDTTLMSEQEAAVIVERTTEHLQQYSQEGLRCLLVAYAELTEEQFACWQKQYAVASTDLSEIEKMKKGQEDNMIERLHDEVEQNLHLLGATAIEDRLQDGVPECIKDLSHAGIKIWMLTGDKEETAVNIAVACNLLLPAYYMEHVTINNKTAASKEAMLRLLQQAQQEYDEDISAASGWHGRSTVPTATLQSPYTPSTTAPNGTKTKTTSRTKASGTGTGLLMTTSSTSAAAAALPMAMKAKPRALVIDGASLIIAMGDKELRNELLKFGQRCRAVVACRVSPDQKREMVNLIKTGVPGVRTLAIGDGANDVAMIQEAHVGVGIKGEEGLQAVNSSDYAIAQFRFLAPLLLKHGRYNYIRMTSVVCYMFYKNILMSMGQFWFNFNNGWSGQKFYTEAAIQMFNLMYTSVPILLLGVYDRDVRTGAVYAYPQLYAAGIRGDYFKPRLFWSWIAIAFLESIWLSVMSLYLLNNTQPDTGTLDTHWMAGALCYSCVIIIINAKICFMQSRFMAVHFSVLSLSVLLWFGTAFLFTSFSWIDYDWYYIWMALMGNGSFWLSMILLVTAVIVKDLFVCTWSRAFHPNPVHIVQEMEIKSVRRHNLLQSRELSHPHTNLSSASISQSYDDQDQELGPAVDNMRSRFTDDDRPVLTSSSSPSTSPGGGRSNLTLYGGSGGRNHHSIVETSPDPLLRKLYKEDRPQFKSPEQIRSAASVPARSPPPFPSSVVSSEEEHYSL